MLLENKCALVTGAGSGIGRQLAIVASRKGMAVALCGRQREPLLETASMLDRSKSNPVIVADVTRSEDRHELVERIASEWGELGVLVNNAGVFQASSLAKTSDEMLTGMFAVNVLAPLCLIRDFTPLLARGRPSRIVNIGSIFGDIPYPLFVAYSASKFALRGLSIGLRRELRAHGIGVTYAAPRATDTAAAAPFEELIKSLQPRLDRPEHVAKRIWAAVEHDSDIVFPRGPARGFVLAERLVSGVVDLAIAKQFAKFHRK